MKSFCLPALSSLMCIILGALIVLLPTLKAKTGVGGEGGPVTQAQSITWDSATCRRGRKKQVQFINYWQLLKV